MIKGIALFASPSLGPTYIVFRTQYFVDKRGVGTIPQTISTVLDKPRFAADLDIHWHFLG